RVCRKLCTVADAEGTCGAGGFCELLDGENGVCRQSVPSSGNSQDEPIDTFSLDLAILNLSRPEAEDSIVLTNHSRSAVEFTVTRRSDVVFDEGERRERVYAEGCEAPNCPMWWVEMRNSEGLVWQDAVQSFTLE